jgi:hypothetical protein
MDMYSTVPGLGKEKMNKGKGKGKANTFTLSFLGRRESDCLESLFLFPGLGG